MDQSDKFQRAREFAEIHLREDILDPKTLPLRETSLNFAISLLRLVVVAGNVVYSAIQLGFSLFLVIGDLLVKGLVRIMPAPKVKGTE